MDSELKDFLMELYLLHGEREFYLTVDELSNQGGFWGDGRQGGFIKYHSNSDPLFKYSLTPRALKLIRGEAK